MVKTILLSKLNHLFSSLPTSTIFLVVGPVLKIKTGFQGFEIRDFKSLQRYDNKFYASVHELDFQ